MPAKHVLQHFALILHVRFHSESNLQIPKDAFQMQGSGQHIVDLAKLPAALTVAISCTQNILQYMEEKSDALMNCHAQKVIHRDIKPEKPPLRIKRGTEVGRFWLVSACTILEVRFSSDVCVLFKWASSIQLGGFSP